MGEIMKTKILVFSALIVPIMALFSLTLYKRHILHIGQEVVLPISGYDPRDLLSGHYLIYTIEYGVQGLCPGSFPKREAYVCLTHKYFSYSELEGCPLYIKGTCSYGRFNAGIEKYYVPENEAKDLEEKVRSKKAKLVLSVTKTGLAQIKNLIIENEDL